MTIPDKYMTMDEAIDHMVGRGFAKTRGAARKKIEAAIRSGKLPAFGLPLLADGSHGPVERIAPDHEPKDDVKKWLRPDEIEDYSTDQLVFPLNYFMSRFGLNKDELMTELRSGRLVAGGERTLHGYKNLAITFNHVTDWLANPDTPPALVDRVWATLRSTLQ